MSTLTIVLLIIAGVLLVGLIVLSIFGRKMQKKQEASQEQIRANAQTYSVLVIDKKRMKLKEAGFPQVVIDSTPKYLRRAKVPVVKGKIGPKVASLMCDDKVFDLIPVKKEVKLVMNGIYIIDVKGARGGLEAAPVKKGFMRKLRDKLSKKTEEYNEKSKAADKAKASAKADKKNSKKK